MNCDKIKRLLSAYIDGYLQPYDMNMLEEHLKICNDCREELTFLKSYKSKMAALGKIEAPKNFLEQVHGRIQESSRITQIMKKIFIPIKIKIPLHAAGALATVVIVILIFRPSQSVKEVMEFAGGGSDSKHLINRQAPMAKKSTGHALGVKKPAGLQVEERTVFARSGVKRKSKTPGGLKTYNITLLIKHDYSESNFNQRDMPESRSFSEAPGIRKELPVADVSGSAFEDEMRSGAAGKRFENEMNDGAAEYAKSAKAKKAGKPGFEKAKDLRSFNLKRSIDKIKSIAVSLRGRIIKKEYNKADIIEYVTLEIPAVNYSTFMNRLSLIGRPRKQPVFSHNGREEVRLRIQLAPAD